MATASVSTPIKSHAGLFSSRTAGGRMPLTPSPRQRNSTTTVPVNLNSSPFASEQGNDGHRASSKSVYGGNLSAHFAKSTSKGHRDSPKSNIVRGVATPRKALELGVSDFTLTGTGHHNKTPSSIKVKKAALKQKTGKTTLSYAADRFIPNRGASSAIANVGSGKLDFPEKQRPKTANSEASTILSTATDDAIAALEGLNLDGDDDESSSYSRPSPNTVAYQDSLANACGVSLNTRILQFKPAPPESSKPIDLRQQYNRPDRKSVV